MASMLAKTILYRLVLPTALLVGALLRPSYISLVYVLFAMFAPLLLHVSPSGPVSSVQRAYFILLLITAFTTSSVQFSYQIYQLFSYTGVDEYTKTCNTSSVNFWLEQVGLIRIRYDTGFDTLRVILPEILALAGSLASIIGCLVLPRDDDVENEQHSTVNGHSVQKSSVRRRTEKVCMTETMDLVLKKLSDFAVILIAGLVGILQPCFFNMIYFLVFLTIGTWWASYKSSSRHIFNGIKIILICYSAVHFLLLYIYQIPFIQRILPGQSFFARLFGFVPILHTDCNKWWSLQIISFDYWTAFANALAVMVLYHILIVQYNVTKHGMDRTSCRSDGSSVHEELLVNDGDSYHCENLPLQQVDCLNVERREVASIFVAAGDIKSATFSGLTAASAFLFHNFYVLALLAMMFWALLYHSVFGLIFLVETCILWVFKDTRNMTLRASACILAYTEFLLLVQYICSMDIRNELPQSSYLELVGFVGSADRTTAFVTLLAKGLLSLPLFGLLRLYHGEKCNESVSSHKQPKRDLDFGASAGSPTNKKTNTRMLSQDSLLGVKIVSSLSGCLVKYWIFAVTLVLLLISVQSPPVLYTVGFFVFFSMLIILVMLSLDCIRRSLYTYWTFLIIYSSVVLVALYCYQFPMVPSIWREITNLSDDWNHDIGLINYRDEGDTGILFVRLAAPISLFIVAVLQLKFFHDQWCRLLTAPSNTVSDNTSREALRELPNFCVSFHASAQLLLERIMHSLWSIAEAHVTKFAMLVLVIFALNDICALNLPIMIFISLALCIPAISSAVSVLLCMFVSALIILRMIYQMHFVVEKNLPDHSTDIICNSSDYTLGVTAQWFGFRKVPVIRDYIGGLIMSLLVMAFQMIVFYHQRHKRLLSRISPPPRGIIFPEANPKNWDTNLIDMVKFLLNYGFYKFGLELSMTMMVVVAWVRMDFLAALLLIWLMIFTSTSRMTCRRLWPVFLLYLALLFPLQYALYVGLPSSLCLDYPWNDWLPNRFQNDNLVFWLDLASYRFNLDVRKSIADFFLLLLVACQEYAFRNENCSQAGDNNSIYFSHCDLQRDNPTHDFIAHQRSFVDFLKIFVFMYGHWITIVMVLMAGLGGVSVFALGYIILAFWMLWQGSSLYILPDYRKTLARWQLLLYYTVFVMFCKVTLQIVACAFIHVLMEAKLCYIRQLFSIVCVSTIPGRVTNYYFPEQQDFDNECTVQKSETQIGFDVFAFFFLVLQRRVLNSWYFQHCIVEYRSEAVLMNRGAVLQHQLIEKEMLQQSEQQKKKFRDIKHRTEQIRTDYEKRLSKVGAFVPQTYGQAKRAGDYYMFEYEPSWDALEIQVETFVPEVTPGAGDFDKLDPAQLVHTAVQRDLDLAGTLDAVETAEQIGDGEKRMITAVSETSKPTQQISSVLYSSEKPKSVLLFLLKLLVSAADWLAAFLNRRSREHRYVAYVLGKEKGKLKEKLKQPLVDASKPVLVVRQEFNQQNLHCVSSSSDIERLENEMQDSCWQQKSVPARFITAVGHCIAAHTDVICYLLAIINHARCAGIISLPLPLLVFFWGSLANPRPTKTFWIVMITYTELVVVIKFICQFGFFSWNNTANIIKGTNSADYLPGILGIRKADYYAFWDIALLVALFFHRYMLRKLGLWKEADQISEAAVTTSLNESASNSNLKDESQTDVRLNVTSVASEEQSFMIGVKNFGKVLFNPPVRYICDLYPFMFLLDLLCFFVVSFGFSSFGYGGTGSVVRDISTNRVPITFVVMLIVISLMIVIDRALYLRKAVKCKFVYQLIIIVFLHIWIFCILPTITYKPAWLNKTAQFLYVVKCLYLLISAWQIRNGYPVLCSGNLITHAYGLPNMVFFKLFMAIPFLFELRTAIDWTWTDTSMPLFDFFNMENFYAVIYNLKCSRTYERNFPAPRGIAKGVIIKYFMGVPMILVLILIIWLPLLAFSLLNRIGIILPPNNVMLTINIEGYPSLFKMEAQGIDLEMLSKVEYQRLQDVFSEHYNSSDPDSILEARNAVAFIKEYTLEDIMKVRFRPESQQPWLISDDALTAMKYELREGTRQLNAIIKFSYERPSSKDSKEPLQHSYALNIPLPVNSTIRHDLAVILNGQHNESMLLKQAWPPYVIVPNEGNIKPASSLMLVMDKSNVTIQAGFLDISMELKTTNSTHKKVWSAELIENNETAALTFPLETVKYEVRSEKYLQMIAFVDRVFPSFATKYVQGGIIAMYVAVVLLAGRIIRGVFTNAPMEVMISEVPNPDYLLKICHDIYLVREAKDFILEQDLFGKLIFLFRSPATLIKWTRNKVKAD